MLKLMIIGNLTRDPEMRSVAVEHQQRNVTNFTVAVNGRRDGEATFIRVTAWDKLAETCSAYLAKGRKVYCCCNGVRARMYQAEDGSTRVSLEATAQEVEFLTPRGEQGEAAAIQPAQAHQAHQAPKAPVQGQFTDVSFDAEELPF